MGRTNQILKSYNFLKGLELVLTVPYQERSRLKDVGGPVSDCGSSFTWIELSVVFLEGVAF